MQAFQMMHCVKPYNKQPGKTTPLKTWQAKYAWIFQINEVSNVTKKPTLTNFIVS